MSSKRPGTVDYSKWDNFECSDSESDDEDESEGWNLDLDLGPDTRIFFVLGAIFNILFIGLIMCAMNVKDINSGQLKINM